MYSRYFVLHIADRPHDFLIPAHIFGCPVIPLSHVVELVSWRVGVKVLVILDILKM